jgi:hypothetical protein
MKKERLCLEGNAPCTLKSSSKAMPSVRPVAKGGVLCPFPWKLHEMLEFIEENGHHNIASWNPDEHSFTVRDSTSFVQDVMPR